MSAAPDRLPLPQAGRYHARSRIFLAASAIPIAAVLLCFAVIAAGLFLSAPVRVAIGPVPDGLAAEAVEIASESGATLRGWFVPGRVGGGAVVLMHGVHSNRLSMVRRARFLSAAGFAVLLFDFQAHGESSGDRITFGAREALDARSAVAYVRRRLPQERVGALGTSLGGAAILLGPDPLKVDAIVLEAVYPDIHTAVENRIRAVLGLAGSLVAPPVTWLFGLLVPPLLGIRAADLRPIERIAEVTAPVLIASGTRDDRTTMANTKALFSRARAPKQLWAVEGARHVDLEAYAPDDYRWRVLPFLVERLQQPR